MFENIAEAENTINEIGEDRTKEWADRMLSALVLVTHKESKPVCRQEGYILFQSTTLQSPQVIVKPLILPSWYHYTKEICGSKCTFVNV